VRDAVALFDQSSMAKFIVQGRDARAVLDGLSTASMDVPVGRVVYTQWLNADAGIEADLTVTRLAEREYLVVTSAGSHQRDLAHLREHVAPDAHCTVTDVTAGLPMLGLMGPGSRGLLAALCGEDLSNDAFAFGTSREIEIGYAIVRASRITYVGELGWELYIPADFALHVFERIVEAGARFGLAFAGFHAMNACRTEKGYRHWGHDIGVRDTPLEAGLSFTCAWDKPGGFAGRDALLRQRDALVREHGVAAPCKRLLQLRLADERRLLYHEEPILADGRIVGSVTSGMYGHRLQASLGMGYVTLDGPVTAQRVASTAFEVEVAGERIPASAQLGAWYDPKMERVRA
jgi:4-methylaminobutanoate oxidase (formaldehyde-forming)